jgi:zinc transporter 1/2/3
MIRHCTGGAAGAEGDGDEPARNCNVIPRDYNMPLRIGTLFVILVTSSIGMSSLPLMVRLKKFSLIVLF